MSQWGHHTFGKKDMVKIAIYTSPSSPKIQKDISELNEILKTN